MPSIATEFERNALKLPANSVQTTLRTQSVWCTLLSHSLTTRSGYRNGNDKPYWNHRTSRWTRSKYNEHCRQFELKLNCSVPKQQMQWHTIRVDKRCRLRENSWPCGIVAAYNSAHRTYICIFIYIVYTDTHTRGYASSTHTLRLSIKIPRKSGVQRGGCVRVWNVYSNDIIHEILHAAYIAVGCRKG